MEIVLLGVIIVTFLFFFFLLCCFVLSAKELVEEIGNLGYEEKERNCMASSNHDGICRSNTFGNSMEVVVLERARFLLLEPTQRTKEDCVNQAIRELAEKYIENTARIFDILIEDAREDFKQTILKQL